MTDPVSASPGRVDVAIIGGGVIGRVIAHRLARAGARVCLIADDAPMATRAAAGMLAGSFETPLNGSDQFLFDFSRAALSEWRSYATILSADLAEVEHTPQTEEKSVGAAFDYRDNGIIGVAGCAEESAAFAHAAAALTGRGVPASYLSAARLLALEPDLSGDVAGGILVADEGQVDPRLLVDSLERLWAQRGHATRIASRAVGIEPGARGPRIRCANGTDVEADRVVIATGAARGLLPDGFIVPVKGEALSLKPPASFSLGRVIRGPGAYICPKADGRIVIGATEVRHADDITPDDEAIATLRLNAQRIAPGLDAGQEIERWAGIRPGTPDDLPILGPQANDGEGAGRGPGRGTGRGAGGRVFYALGHYRNGVLWSALTARLIVEAILDTGVGALAHEAFSVFSPNRFDR